MSQKVKIIIVLALAATLLFSACERSASQPPLATPTAVGTSLTAQPTNLSLVQAWGTKTAMYVDTMVALGTFTPAPTTVSGTPQATATPLPPGTVAPTSILPATGAPTATPVPGTTPIVPIVTVAPLVRPATYILQSGEFPYCIARRYNIDPSDLLALNGLSSGQLLQPGTKLSIPSSGSFPGVRALNSHPATYTVAVNDTIYKIACYFGDVDPNAIAAANGLALTTPLTTGQILNIP
jgi:LysM repeat protein